MSPNERVKKIRKDKGLTLEKFGSALGIGKTAVSKIEHGENALTEQNIKSICREFGINEDWLRTGEGTMEACSDDDLKIRIDNLINDEDEDFRLRLTRMILAMDKEDMLRLENYAKIYLCGIGKKSQKSSTSQNGTEKKEDTA